MHPYIINEDTVKIDIPFLSDIFALSANELNWVFVKIFNLHLFFTKYYASTYPAQNSETVYFNEKAIDVIRKFL